MSEVVSLRLIEGDRARSEQDERLRDVELLSGVATVELGANRRITFLSSAAWRLIGIDNRAAMNCLFEDVFFSEQSAQMRAKVLRDMLALKAISQIRTRPAYDPTRLVEASLRPTMSSTGQLSGWRGIVRLAATEHGEAAATSPHRVLGLMSEALLHRAQDLLMAADGALELSLSEAGDCESTSTAHAAVRECLDVQAAYVGFCRTYLLDESMRLVAPILARAAILAAIDRGVSANEFTIVRHEGLLVVADEDVLTEEIRAWLANVVPRRDDVGATFVHPVILTLTVPGGFKARRLGFKAILNVQGEQLSGTRPPLIYSTNHLAFSPSEAILALAQTE